VRASAVSLLACWLLTSPVSLAQPKPIVATARAGGGQPLLAVGIDAGGALRARVCAAAPCGLEGGRELALPAAARARLRDVRLTVVPIGKQRRVIVVTIPEPAQQRAWEAVIAAPLRGSEPLVLFEGMTGLAEGEYGLRHGGMVMISEPRPDASRSVVIGEQREDLSLCGRPAVLSPRLVWPDDLSLRPAKVQRLTPGERDGATRIVAQRSEQPEGTRIPLLRAVAATSAVGSPSALTDGDPETTWSENRGGAGRGEFVLMQAPPALPITALELVVRPPTRPVELGVAPKELWIASADRVLHVTLPEDAWQHAGARYLVPLDRPLRSDCLALITESAWGGSAKSRVTLAELTAHTEFDQSTLDGLVGALAGGGKRAEAAASALSALGPPAFERVVKAWDRLDEGGRRVALDVIDHAPCEIRSPLYLRALFGPYAAHRIHARDRLRSCGKDAAQAIEAALQTAPRRAHPLLVNELALVGPERAVLLTLPLLAKADQRGRQLLRVALGRAARRDAAASAVREMLRDRAQPEVARIDLLRALGDQIRDFQPDAGQALAVLARPDAGFRARYLLLEPAAALAAVDPAAKGFVARSLSSDPSPFVRTQAAAVIASPAEFRAELSRALEDPEVRVREAALRALARPGGSFAGGAVARRLATDRWPIVRAAAAEAIATMGPSRELDVALDRALEDPSYHVRAPAVAALGERRARSFAARVRERLEDKEEITEVRGSAALALGLMCDSESVELLTGYAKKLADPLLSAEERAISSVALGALSRIHPPDLARRLRPLLGKDVAPLARAAAQAALRSPGSCGRRR
jgi:HEAT repeat protein